VSSPRKRTSSRRKSARRWIVLGILVMVAAMGAVVAGVVVLIRGPEMQSAQFAVQGTPLQIRMELKQRSVFDKTFDRTLRATVRDRQRQAQLRADPGGFARVNLYRQTDRVIAVGWGGTVSMSITTGDLEILPGPVLPESPIGYLGAFDVDEQRKLRFFGAAECPFVAVAPADRPRACRS
jgi:hypothetical protein